MNESPAVPTSKRWGLVAGFVVAALFPIVMLGSRMTPDAWAWFALFILNALFAAFTDVYF